MRKRVMPGFLALLLMIGLAGTLDAQPPESEEPPGYLRERFEWFYRQRFDPPELPHGLLRLQAVEKARQMPLYTAPGFGPLQSGWEFLGPQRLDQGWNGSACAGQVTALAVDPFDPSVLYAGGGSGGLWKSTSGGSVWLCISQELPTGSSGALAIDPQDRNTIYYGTGEYTLSLYSYGGAGIFRSRNGGLTWEQLGRDVFTRQRCASIQIHPTNRNVLWAGMSRGLYKSTDGGVTWRRTLRGMVQEVLLHPQNPSILYAAVGHIDGRNRNGFYQSTDGGETWVRFANLPSGRSVGRVEAALCRSQPQVLYVTFAAPPGGLVGMYKTTNGGLNWTRLASAPDYGESQSWYNNVVAVDPTDPKIVYLGGLSLWRSTDGGQTWTDVGRSYRGGRLHPDIHALAFHPYDTRILYIGCDGGVYWSLDRGTNWVELNTALANAEFYSLAINPRNPDVVFGGTQDNGSPLKPAFSLFWRIVFWGDGGYCAFKRTDPNTMYTEFLRLEMYRSRDGGATWTPIWGGLNRAGALFIAPFVLDPVDPNVLYAGSRVLSVSSDEGDTWRGISPDFGAAISAIAVATPDFSVADSSPRQGIYVGLEDGRVFKRTGGGWVEITRTLPRRYVTSLAVAPDNPQLVYVTFSGFGSRHVFRSADGGTTWEDISGDLPNIPVNACLIHPDNTDALIVGTDIGVFFTPNRGQNWYRLDQGLPAAVVVLQMAYYAPARYVYIATHGRGVWRAPIPAVQ